MAELDLLLSFPPDDVSSLSAKDYDRSIVEYIRQVERIPAAAWTRQTDKHTILDSLDPATNTIPYAIALQHQIRATADLDRLRELLDSAIVFFTCFDPRQAYFIANAFTLLLGWFFDGFRDATDLSPLSAALLRLDPTAGTFTSHHIRFLRMCLTAGVPSQALPILDKNIYAYPQHRFRSAADESASEAFDQETSNSWITTKSGLTDPVNVVNVLEYYTIGAMVYIGVRNWERARLFLEMVMLSPSQQHSVSMFQIEAYKKWVLVGLLSQGTSYPLPRTIDQAVLRTIRALARPYDAIAEAAGQRDWKRYHAEEQTGSQIWIDDGNQEMVREAGIAIPRYLVLDLQKTYAALPIGRVARHVSLEPKETLTLLTETIRHGHLNASIRTDENEPAQAILQFHAATSPAKTLATRELDLQAQTQRIEALVRYLQDADRRLQLSKEYIDHVRRQKRVAQGPDGDLAEHMDLTWDAPLGPNEDEGDEDIMAA